MHLYVLDIHFTLSDKLKVNNWTQELIQSYLHKVLNIKQKDRQIQLAVLSQKGGNSVTET